MLDFCFYTGKKEAPRPHALAHHVVMTVGSRFLDKHHHFYFDNYFSSVRLAKDLLNRTTYFCAKTRQNPKAWPQDLKTKVGKGECLMRQVGNIVATFGMTRVPSLSSPPTLVQRWALHIC
ncbi:PiggyBac transposable element-derived protein 4 [Plakobranchus ocellatus]|uniref:PiggyBac transposable element-derived protein 4 n=1 Tax=Plakobranchus ocellatus TaxID=259542 RepID=A0AAV4C2I1_9GAST|nr:PiggyBac transposable element-derived protein 4 [Plakobranchus ocellatus]